MVRSIFGNMGLIVMICDVVINSKGEKLSSQSVHLVKT